MQIGDLVKLWVNAEWYVVGILVEKNVSRKGFCANTGRADC